MESDVVYIDSDMAFRGVGVSVYIWALLAACMGIITSTTSMNWFSVQVLN